jgi:glycosyltransferase involved in cell wall biosynthesis
MIHIEIILVIDKSKDHSLKIIENIQKYDKRIKIINNKKNMGTLYSRSIGVLQSKGNYIFPLDNDDMFFDDDVFDFIYEEANNFNYDIVGFKTIQANSYKARINEMRNGCHMHNENFIIYQPNLSLFGISKNNRFNTREVHIWSKCIKNSIYKKAINSLGRKRYSFFMSWAEDTSMVFVLFNVAESYRYIIKYGIFRYNRKNSASVSMPKSHKLFGEILFLDVIFDFTKNDFKSKKFAVYKAINIRNGKYYKSLNEIKYYSKYVYYFVPSSILMFKLGQIFEKFKEISKKTKSNFYY